MKIIKTSIIIILPITCLAVWLTVPVTFAHWADGRNNVRTACEEYGTIGEDVIIANGQCWIKPE